MTMQTDRPIEHIQVSTTNRPLGWILDFGRSDRRRGLDVDQPYQRGDVWGLTRRRNLVRSMLLGVPIPSLVVNDRLSADFREAGYNRDRNWAYAIVDGKQRVTTWLMFGARFKTLAAERMVFDLVNFGGVAQGETDDDLVVPA